MKLLIEIGELDKYKSRDKIPLECQYCEKTFYLQKNYIQCAIKGKTHQQGKFCSRLCNKLAQEKKIQLLCKQCNKTVLRIPSQIYGKNTFCSSKCSGTYNSQHKTTGSNRSKLEKWLETQLNELYPNLTIEYNDKETINAELDIYIPLLKLAFELNGIFHYEDIFGQLERTKNNDKRKILACAEKQIGLCIIDTSKQKYFKEKTAIEFLNIIINIIDKKMEESSNPALHT